MGDNRDEDQPSLIDLTEVCNDSKCAFCEVQECKILSPFEGITLRIVCETATNHASEQALKAHISSLHNSLVYGYSSFSKIITSFQLSNMPLVSTADGLLSLMSPNYLSSLSECDPELIDLHHIHIEYTSISTMPLNINQFQSLIYLNLNNNNLLSLGPKLLYLPHLTHLDVSCNHLRSLDYLQNLTALKTLIAASNSLRSLQLAVGVLLPLSSSVSPSLIHLDIRDNLLCGSHGYAMDVLSMLKSLQILDGQPRDKYLPIDYNKEKNEVDIKKRKQPTVSSVSASHLGVTERLYATHTRSFRESSAVGKSKKEESKRARKRIGEMVDSNGRRGRPREVHQDQDQELARCVKPASSHKRERGVEGVDTASAAMQSQSAPRAQMKHVIHEPSSQPPIYSAITGRPVSSGSTVMQPGHSVPPTLSLHTPYLLSHSQPHTKRRGTGGISGGRLYAPRSPRPSLLSSDISNKPNRSLTTSSSSSSRSKSLSHPTPRSRSISPSSSRSHSFSRGRTTSVSTTGARVRSRSLSVDRRIKTRLSSTSLRYSNNRLSRIVTARSVSPIPHYSSPERGRGRGRVKEVESCVLVPLRSHTIGDDNDEERGMITGAEEDEGIRGRTVKPLQVIPAQKTSAHTQTLPADLLSPSPFIAVQEQPLPATETSSSGENYHNEDSQGLFRPFLQQNEPDRDRSRRRGQSLSRSTSPSAWCPSFIPASTMTHGHSRHSQRHALVHATEPDLSQSFIPGQSSRPHYSLSDMVSSSKSADTAKKNLSPFSDDEQSVDKNNEINTERGIERKRGMSEISSPTRHARSNSVQSVIHGLQGLSIQLPKRSYDKPVKAKTMSPSGISIQSSPTRHASDRSPKISMLQKFKLLEGSDPRTARSGSHATLQFLADEARFAPIFTTLPETMMSSHSHSHSHEDTVNSVYHPDRRSNLETLTESCSPIFSPPHSPLQHNHTTSHPIESASHSPMLVSANTQLGFSFGQPSLSLSSSPDQLDDMHEKNTSQTALQQMTQWTESKQSQSCLSSASSILTPVSVRVCNDLSSQLATDRSPSKSQPEQSCGWKENTTAAHHLFQHNSFRSLERDIERLDLSSEYCGSHEGRDNRVHDADDAGDVIRTNFLHTTKENSASDVNPLANKILKFRLDPTTANSNLNLLSSLINSK